MKEPRRSEVHDAERQEGEKSLDTLRSDVTLPDVNIEEDDYTKRDARRKGKGQSAEASVRRTTGADDAKEAAKAGKRVKQAVGAILAVNAASTMKTRSMEKKAGREAERIDREQRKAPKGPGNSFWDAFANAFARIQLEQKMERLKKLQKKVEGRKRRSQQLGMVAGAVFSSVGAAARTRGMQSSMELLTGSQAGEESKNIVTGTSQRGGPEPAEESGPSPLASDAELSM